MKKVLLRLSILIFALAIFVYYISKNLGTIEQTFVVTFSQSIGYLSLAFAASALAFLFLGLMNRTVFAMLGIKRSPLEMVLLRAQALAVNVMVPSGGVSVGVVFAGDAKKHGDSEAAAVTGVILALLADYAAVSVLLLVAIFYLLSTNSLSLTVVIPAVAFFALTIGLSLLILFAGRNKPLLRKILDYLKVNLNMVSHFFKRPKIVKNETAVDNFMAELTRAYEVMGSHRGQLILAFFYVLVSHFMYLVTLYVLFLSLGIDPLLRILVTGYAIGVSVIVISPTPNGVGFVEGTMALAYSSMGIPGAAAATVTLIYRGFSFWLPFFIGFVALQRRHIIDLIRERKQ